MTFLSSSGWEVGDDGKRDRLASLGRQDLASSWGLSPLISPTRASSSEDARVAETFTKERSFVLE